MACSCRVQNLQLTRLVPIERCRLVKFDEYTETLDQSFDMSQQVISCYPLPHAKSYISWLLQDATFGYHVGGARSYYSFELFMEIRAEGTEFKAYNKGGLNLKILIIDLPGETVREPVQFRAEQGWTVEELRNALAEVHTEVQA